jgi:hypothetical protein
LQKDDKSVKGDYPIEYAKEKYEKQLKLSYIYQGKVDEYNPAQFNPKPQWNEAKFYKIGDQVHLNVPVKYNSITPIFGVTEEAEKDYKKYGNRLRSSVNLVISRKNGLIYMAYQVFFGDEQFLSIEGNTAEKANFANIPKGFSGFETVFDLNGKPLKAWRYKDEKVYDLKKTDKNIDGQLSSRCASQVCVWSAQHSYVVEDGVFTILGTWVWNCYYIWDCQNYTNYSSTSNQAQYPSSGSTNNNNSSSTASAPPPISAICISALRNTFQNVTPINWNNQGGAHTMPIGNIATYVADFQNLQLTVGGSADIPIHIKTFSITVYGAPGSTLTPNIIANEVAEAFDKVRIKYGNPPPLDSWESDYNNQFLADWTKEFNNKQDNKINPNNSNSKNRFGASITTVATASDAHVLVNKDSNCQ